ncbi:hypothetical protein JTB14_005291 [Gonioctena quinquepunctata]|nr:hypothetical protein JTB14_005291 [Gonioctena quinquepunctata]
MLLCRLFALRPISLNNFVLDDGASENQQIWAVDSSVFPRSNLNKNHNNNRGNPALIRPVYILQPEAETVGGRGHRRHDRGRSFSPAKPYHKQVRDVVVSASSPREADATAPQQTKYNEGFRKSFSSEQLHYSGKPCHDAYSLSLSSGSSASSTASSMKANIWQREMRSGIPIPISSETKLRLRTNTSCTNNNTSCGPVIARRLWRRDGEASPRGQCAGHLLINAFTNFYSIPNSFRVIMCNNNVVNPWGLRDTAKFQCNFSECCPCIFRGRKVVDIRVPVTKLSTPVLAITDPPESREKSALGTAPDTPITHRLSPRDTVDYGNTTQSLPPPPPPRSSGSESSGYFTPPHSAKRAFVKLDSEIRSSESDERDEAIGNDKNNNSSNCLETFDDGLKEILHQDEPVERNSPTSSGEICDPKAEVMEPNVVVDHTASDDDSQGRSSVSHRFSISSSKELSFISSVSTPLVKKTKSKSVVDLQNFLPEITTRKSTSSAPPFKDELLGYDDLIITSYEDVAAFPAKTSSAETVAHEIVVHEISRSPKEITIKRKLSRRLSRTPSRRSVKSTPRSVRDITPKTSNMKPKECLQTALAQLNNQEWEVMIQGLQGLTKIAKNHPDVIEANIHNVCVNLARHIKNLRSQVARSACHTATELFGSCRRNLDMELEEIAGPLLHRTADTNKFLRADANAALDVMCEQLPPSRVITVITSRGCNHQNNVVRSASMRLLTNVVKKLGADRIFLMNKDMRDRVILAEISVSTLRNNLKQQGNGNEDEATAKPAETRGLGRKPLLTKQQEKERADHVVKLENMFYGVTPHRRLRRS